MSSRRDNIVSELETIIQTKDEVMKRKDDEIDKLKQEIKKEKDRNIKVLEDITRDLEDMKLSEMGRKGGKVKKQDLGKLNKTLMPKFCFQFIINQGFFDNLGTAPDPYSFSNSFKTKYYVSKLLVLILLFKIYREFNYK